MKSGTSGSRRQIVNLENVRVIQACSTENKD
jgi:hypothetical protein